MTEIRVKAKTEEEAQLILRVLRAMRFEPEAVEEKPKTIGALYEALKGKGGPHLFQSIKDPVEWQRKLRDEWERS